MLKVVSLVVLNLLLVACGGGGGSPAPTPNPTPPPEPEPLNLLINANNLSGELRLELNQSETLSVNSDGRHAFTTTFEQGDAYQVSLEQLPTGQNCQLENANGEFTTTDLTLNLVCTNKAYSIGGQVRGLSGKLNLSLNNNETLMIEANGAFTFNNTLAHLENYTLAITTQPQGQTCTLNQSLGSINDSDINTIELNCSNNRYPLGGSIIGLRGQIALQIDGGQTIELDKNGDFTFANQLEFNSAYSVSITRQATGQSCNLSNATGQIGVGGADNLRIICSNTPYQISATVSGLGNGRHISLQLNSRMAVNTSTNGRITLASDLIYLEAYNVSIANTVAGQSCSISRNSGVMPAANVSNIEVVCQEVDYHIGGESYDLIGALDLRLSSNGNAVETLNINSNGAFRFNRSFNYNTPYLVEIVANPTGQSCSLLNPQGRILTQSISNIGLNCVSNRYAIGGTFSNLKSKITLNLFDGASLSDTVTIDTATIQGNRFSFPQSKVFNSNYRVSIASQPIGQSCQLDNATGTVPAADVNNLSLTCTDTQYTLGGLVSVLNGSLDVTLAPGFTTTVSSNGLYTLDKRLIHDTPYAVSISRQPDGQMCNLANGNGKIDADNVSNLDINCSNLSYAVAGNVSGLNEAVTLNLSSGVIDEDLLINSNGSYQFNNTVEHGASFSVTIKTQASTQTCLLANLPATINASAINNADLDCGLNPVITSVWPNPVYPGAKVKVSGHNLNPAAQLSFNGSNQTLETNQTHLLSFQAADISPANYAIDLATKYANTSVNIDLKALFEVRQVATGRRHSCAIADQNDPALGNQVYCWGDNDMGQLGNGGTSPSITPVAVTGIDNAIAISSQFNHSCALLVDHSLSCWGDNTEQQLGNSDTSIHGPIAVAGLGHVLSVSTSQFNSCAIVLDDKGSLSTTDDEQNVYCWGNNMTGQLGNNTSGAAMATPSQVIGLSTATAISSGTGFNCALLADQTIACWGFGINGSLGNAANANASTPVSVANITQATAISSGGSHSCALLSDNSVQCWGTNEEGQLGDSSQTQRNTPVAVADINSATAISTGMLFSCALLANEQIQCWGANSDGQLGNNGTAHSTSPSLQWGMPEATQISSGFEHSCLINKQNTLQCWGNNAALQLGYDNRSSKSIAIKNAVDATQISSGNSHNCALRQGEVWCWGSNSHGQLGNGNKAHQQDAVQVSNITNAIQLSSGEKHSCALLSTKVIQCWGDNSAGQLGDGTTVEKLQPVTVTDINNAIALASGAEHNCALLQDNSITCWGANGSGQLGNGDTTSQSAPTAISNINNAVEIALGQSHSCARLSDQSIMCWGSNFAGQLGDGTNTIANPISSSPVAVSGITSATALATGKQHSCALLQDQSIACWGDNTQGQLGDGSTDDSNTPQAVSSINNATRLSGSSSQSAHTCAYLSNDQLVCWGANKFAQLGNGTASEGQTTPLQNNAFTQAKQISLGNAHSCAILQDDTVHCLGNNDFGESGLPIYRYRLGPVLLAP